MKTFKSASVYVRGKSHEEKGTPCQDRTFDVIEKSMAIISLADGAGSCKSSHIGAEIASKAVCEYLRDHFDLVFSEDEEIGRALIHYHLIAELSRTALMFETDVMDLSSTLLFVAVMADRYFAGHIGDGVIGVLKNEAIEVLSHPERGEYANESFFITGDDATNHFRIMKGDLDGIEGFVLMSDGPAQGLYDYKDKTLSLGSRKMLEYLDEHDTSDTEEALRKSIEEVLKKKTNDDCSINILKLVNVIEKKDRRFQFGFPFRFSICSI